MVSPTMMQNAIIPPNALLNVSCAHAHRQRWCLQCPLSDRNGDQTRLAVTMLHGRLKRVLPAKLGVCDDESDRPVHSDRKSKQENDSSQ